MPYIQCILKTIKDRADLITDCLMEAGAESVTFEDEKDLEDSAIFEPLPNTEILWDDIKVIGLFLSDIDLLALASKLQAQLNEQEIESLKFEGLEDKDWVTLTQVTKPLTINNKLMIGPLNIKPEIQIPYLILDAGLAFGTGSHPTTQLCLKFLTNVKLKHKIVLDYGCGSGILGLASLKLGAKYVYAVDHDPQALLSTQNNAQKNNYDESKIKTFLPGEFNTIFSEKNKKNKIDVIVANILAQPLITLAKSFSHYLDEKGIIILSGLLKNQKDLIISEYSHSFNQIEMLEKEDWLALKMHRK